jgi:hypothetical protein
MSPPTSAPLVKMPPPRRAKAETDQAVGDDAALFRHRQVEPEAAGKDEIVPGDGQKAEAHHQHAGDGAGAKGHRQARCEAGARGFRRAHIGAHRNIHADITGRARQRRADQEADGDLPAEENEGENEDHHAHHGDGRILPVEIGLGAFLHRGGDFLHARVAGAQTEHGSHGP